MEMVEINVWLRIIFNFYILTHAFFLLKLNIHVSIWLLYTNIYVIQLYTKHGFCLVGLFDLIQIYIVTFLSLQMSILKTHFTASLAL